MTFLTNHVRDTENPQTYFSHWKFGFINSLKLIGAGVIGIVHAFFPWWFPFTTSSIVIRSFKKLVDSNRHKLELNEIMPDGYLNKKHLKIKK